MHGASTRVELERHIERVATILWNHGADVIGPHLDQYAERAIILEVSGTLPGPVAPRPTDLLVREVWEPTTDERYLRTGYTYDLVDHPNDRRRAFHAHDRAHFVGEFDTVTHEHCEESRGRPTCEHYYGLPIDAYEAIRRLSVLWGHVGPLGCDELRCMT